MCALFNVYRYPIIIIFLATITVLLFEEFISKTSEKAALKIFVQKKITKQKYEPKYDSLNFIRISTYQAVVGQTDARPLETASMISVTPNMYWKKKNSFGYCAVSRDLLNWHFNFHDTLYCEIDSTIYGFIVIDTMNKRFYNAVDLLTMTNFLLTSKRIWFKR